MPIPLIRGVTLPTAVGRHPDRSIAFGADPTWWTIPQVETADGLMRPGNVSDRGFTVQEGLADQEALRWRGDGSAT
jgi:hypothetical protein